MLMRDVKHEHPLAVWPHCTELLLPLFPAVNFLTRSYWRGRSSFNLPEKMEREILHSVEKNTQSQQYIVARQTWRSAQHQTVVAEEKTGLSMRCCMIARD
jgi:hypothetical protein